MKNPTPDLREVGHPGERECLSCVVRDEAGFGEVGGYGGEDLGVSFRTELDALTLHLPIVDEGRR